MKRAALLLSAALLAACGNSTGSPCTRGDELSPCSRPTSAEEVEPGHWHVVLRTTVSSRVEYDIDGNVCAFTRTRCIAEECHFYGGISSASQAIAECRENYGRDP